jgi:hypothetical protein
VSQLLTLYITPVYYVYIEGARLWLAGRGQQADTADTAPRHDVHALPVEKAS